MRIKEATAFLDSLEKKGIVFGLEREKKFLSFIGNPEKKFKSILVAGSKGKGSTAAMIESVLRKAGYKTGLYTSPHLMHFSERIRVDGKRISGRELARLVSELKEKMKFSKISLTFFEFTTALAFEFFSEKKIDFAVAEIGMGGRLDAANVLSPFVSVITNIEKEHEKFLGNTLAKIAREKAGIIKKETPLVTAEKNRKLTAIFERKCREKNSKIIIVKKPFSGRLSLKGEFQRINAALAIAAINEMKKQGFEISNKAITEGLVSVQWPGRFETVQKNPLVIIDCCHTPNSALALADSFRKIFGKKKAVLIVGIAKGKNFTGIVSALSPIALLSFSCEAKIRGMSALRIKKEFEKNRVMAIAVKSVKRAVKKAISTAGKKGIVLVAGSCFTAGEAMELLFI